jgi:acetyltransferase
MIDEVRAARLLTGYRGAPPASRAALLDVLIRLGRLAASGNVSELDINPLLALPDRAVALDALLVPRVRPAHLPANPREEPKVRDLTPILEPASIAVVGASTNPDKAGGILLNNIIRGGYSGRIYPINPRAAEVQGHPAYANIADVPGPVDCAYITLPRAGVRDALEACARKGVRSAVIVTAGYREVGQSGAQEQEVIADTARRTGIRVVGPNTIGLVSTSAKLLASFVPFDTWEEGPVAIFAQTGIFAGAPTVGLMSQPYQRLGIRISLDVGNKPDVNEVDFLHYVAGRDDLGVIGLYLESIQSPAGFLEIASRVKRDKPVVVLKPGRTPAGAAASASHTGSLAGDDRVLDAGLRQYGLVRAYDFEEFIGLLRAFSWQTAPRGPRLGIVTYSGALGVIATDEAVENSLEMATWAPETLERLQQLTPDWQPVGNPADLWVALDVVEARRAHEAAFEAALADPGTDAVLGILLAVPAADFEGVREAFGGLRKRHPDKPLFLVIYGGPVRERWMQELDGLGIPVFGSSRLAVRCLAAMQRYATARDRLYANQPTGGLAVG